ncbi:MAG: metallophosphoesterase family protein [Pyrobaculum sp.]
MRLLIVADIHDALDNVRSIGGSYDAVIAAGDFTYGSLEAAVRALKTLAHMAPVYFVPGNWDPPQLADYREGGIYPVHGRVARLGPYVVGGVGGSLPTPFDDFFRLSEEEIESLLARLDPPPHILVTHNPPRGRLDKVGRVRPVGSLAVRRYIESRRPLLSVHGHIHEDWGVDLLGDTVVVNPGSLASGQYAEAVVGSRVEVQIRHV